MDVCAIGSKSLFSTRPATIYPFAFNRELCQDWGVCWCCQHAFDYAHRANKKAGQPICSDPPVSGPEMDAYCFSCTTSSPTPITDPPAPVQLVASKALASPPSLLFWWLLELLYLLILSPLLLFLLIIVTLLIWLPLDHICLPLFYPHPVVGSPCQVVVLRCSQIGANEWLNEVTSEVGHQ